MLRLACNYFQALYVKQITMNFVIAEKNSKRILGIVDSVIGDFVKKNLSIFDVFEIESVGSFSTSTDKGTISGISVSIVGWTDFLKDSYIMINKLPDNITLEEGYKLIL